MVLNFYTIKDDPRKLKKTLGEAVHTIQNAAVYEECSIMTPHFIVDYSSVIITANYIYCPIWNRYYFIRDFVAMPGERLLIMCSEDVLMGNAEDILKLNCNVVRTGNQNLRDKFIIDSKWLVKSGTYYETKQFTGGLTFSDSPTNHCYFVTVIGGYHTSQQQVVVDSNGNEG